MNHRQHTWRGFSILFPLLLIGFIFSTGCETSSPDLFANLDSLRLPFEEGRVWEYEYTYSEIYAQGTYNSDSRRRAVVRITASGIDTLDNGWVANLLVTDWEMWYEVGTR